MEICKPEKCTGCFACVNSCKHGCIKMTENELGALLPIIDEDSCIHCGACIKSCPNNIKLEFYNPIGCHAAWIKNKEKRRICASGGIASIFSEKCTLFFSGFSQVKSVCKSAIFKVFDIIIKVKLFFLPFQHHF